MRPLHDAPRGRRLAHPDLRVHGRRASFTLEHTFACSPSELWPWLTEPAQIAAWSTAPVTMDGPFAEGAARTVLLRLGPLPLLSLVEVLTSVERERSFAYSGRTLDNHRGRAVLQPEGAHTQLSWTAEFEAPVAGLARPMALFARWQMGDSFRKLSQLLPS